MIQQSEAVQAIDALATKLSVPTAKLWAVLTAQAKIEALSTFAWAVIVPALWFVWWRVLSWTRKQDAESRDRYNGWGDLAGLIGIMGALLLTILSLVLVQGVFDAVGYLINPEYYALNQVLKVLK